MDVVIPDIQTFEHFAAGLETYITVCIPTSHEELNQIKCGCEVNVFLRTNTGTDFLQGVILKMEGEVKTIPSQGPKAYKLLVKRK